MKTDTKEKIWNYVMLIGLLAIFVSAFLVYDEIHGAKSFCKSVGGQYKLHLFPLPVIHYCNGDTIVKYSDGWDFVRMTSDFNITISYP